MEFVGPTLGIVLSNIIAYYIFLTFVTDAPAELIIFFTFVALIGVDFFRRTSVQTKDGDVDVYLAEVAFFRWDRELTQHVLVTGLAVFFYNFCFWQGFTRLTANPGLVLSILALNIFLTPFAVRRFEKISMIPVPATLVGVIMLVAASYMFTLDTSIEDFSRAFWSLEALSNVDVWAVFFICCALFFEILQDVEQARLYSRVDTYNCYQGILETDRRKSFIYEITYARQLPFSLLCAFGLLVLAGLQQDFWSMSFQSFLTFGVLTIVFVLFGVAIRAKLNARLRSKNLRTEVLAVAMAMRPVVFYLTYPVVALFIFLLGCRERSCEMFGVISVTNGFVDTYPSDAIAVIVVLIAGIIFSYYLTKHGFFSE